MSPKHKGPLKKPQNSNRSMQRARDGATGAGSAGAAEPADGAAEKPAEAAAVGDDLPGRGADESDSTGLQLIGQEMVPVEKVEGTKEAEGDRLEGQTHKDQFSTPAAQKSFGTSPEQLQLQNSPFVKSNEKGSEDETGEKRVVAVPNGPPVSLGPAGTPSLPLFSPEQVQQMTDPRLASSMLPLGNEPVPGADLLDYQGSCSSFSLDLIIYTLSKIRDGMNWSGESQWNLAWSNLASSSERRSQKTVGLDKNWKMSKRIHRDLQHLMISLWEIGRFLEMGECPTSLPVLKRHLLLHRSLHSLARLCQSGRL